MMGCNEGQNHFVSSKNFWLNSETLLVWKFTFRGWRLEKMRSEQIINNFSFKSNLIKWIWNISYLPFIIIFWLRVFIKPPGHVSLHALLSPHMCSSSYPPYPPIRRDDENKCEELEMYSVTSKEVQTKVKMKKKVRLDNVEYFQHNEHKRGELLYQVPSSQSQPTKNQKQWNKTKTVSPC